MSRKPKSPMSVKAGLKCVELGRQQGIVEALEVVLKYFQNDWTGVEAIRELKKLQEPRP